MSASLSRSIVIPGGTAGRPTGAVSAIAALAPAPLGVIVALDGVSLPESLATPLRGWQSFETAGMGGDTRSDGLLLDTITVERVP